MSEGGQQNEAQFNSLIAAIKNGYFMTYAAHWNG